MKRFLMIPIFFILLLGCVANTQIVEEEPPKNPDILYMTGYNCACNDLQTDFLYMFNSGKNESSFVDYGTRAHYRIGQWVSNKIPTYGSTVYFPPDRKTGEVRWYTFVEFLSYGRTCSVTVRRLNPNPDNKVNGTEIVELLRKLKK